jgi:plastocyanin
MRFRQREEPTVMKEDKLAFTLARLPAHMGDTIEGTNPTSTPHTATGLSKERGRDHSG